MTSDQWVLVLRICGIVLQLGAFIGALVAYRRINRHFRMRENERILQQGKWL